MPFPARMLYHDGTSPFGHNPETHEAEGSWSVEFDEKFSDFEVGTEPENLFILDGAYAVTQEENDKRLTLPGSPVGDFGLLFGPRVREKSLSLSFSFLQRRRVEDCRLWPPDWEACALTAFA